jgi:hypothetical protein
VTEVIQSRRGFIAGLGALFIAAPAIVRATSIMPVKAVDWSDGYTALYMSEGAPFEFSGFYSVFPIGSVGGTSIYGDAAIIAYDILTAQTA